jgi:hypothetical protein
MEVWWSIDQTQRRHVHAPRQSCALRGTLPWLIRAGGRRDREMQTKRDAEYRSVPSYLE